MATIDAAIADAADDATAPVTVLFEDETDIRRLPPLRSMWMRRGEQARVQIPSGNAQAEALPPFALYGALDPLTGETFAAPYPKGRSDYTASFLDALMKRFSGEVVLVWDQASWHTSKATAAVIASYDRLRVLLLPKRAPQENPVEDLWRALKRIVAANLTRGLDVLKAACQAFFERLTGDDVLRLTGLAD